MGALANRFVRYLTWNVLLIAIAAGATRAAAPTCVTACQNKANTCARKCTDVVEMGAADCQLTCAKALFVPCVSRCQRDNVVISDDYRVVAPGEVESEAETDEAAAEEPAFKEAPSEE